MTSEGEVWDHFAVFLWTLDLTVPAPLGKGFFSATCVCIFNRMLVLNYCIYHRKVVLQMLLRKKKKFWKFLLSWVLIKFKMLLYQRCIVTTLFQTEGWLTMCIALDVYKLTTNSQFRFFTVYRIYDMMDNESFFFFFSSKELVYVRIFCLFFFQ